MLVVELFRECVGTEADIAAKLPPHIRSWAGEKKLEWLLELIKPVVDDLYLPYTVPNMEPVKVAVRHLDKVYHLTLPPELQGKNYHIVVPGGVKLVIPVPSDAEVFPPTQDEVHDYNLAYMRAMLDFVILDNIVRAGDIERLPAILKRLLPLFVGLTSFMSKYSIEIINFLTKTEHILSPRESAAVKLRAFVNTSGTCDGNKPADMQQENNIKAVKNVVRGLGAGKTNKALIRSSKAAPGINQLVDDLSSSFQLKPERAHCHKYQKDDGPDKDIVSGILRENQPFRTQPGRKSGLPKVCCPSVAHKVDKFELNQHIKRNSERVVNHMPVDINFPHDVAEEDD